jgi:predicted TIM-barrel enzyme
MWVALYVLATVLFTYMLFFADSAERAVTQVLLMASVTVVVVSSLLLINFFNHPFGTGVGTLEPSAMERILHLVQSEMPAVGIDVSPPCDSEGNPR